MIHSEALHLLVGAVALGAVHGVEPGHGWPVAASYALDKSNKWLYGLLAGVILGVGHLVSSIAMVGVFFYAKSYFALTQVNQPITVVEGVRIGGPVSLVAGVLLVALGIREYRHGHSHDHGDGDDGHSHNHGTDHAHDGDDHGHHGHSHDHADRTHDHADKNHRDETAQRGLLGLAWFAFLLGFAHEEEFEIIALCAGSNYCLELMGAYAAAVLVGIVGLTLLLVAGYHHFEAQVEQYTPYLPAFSAAVLVVMGVGLATGLF